MGTNVAMIKMVSWWIQTVFMVADLRADIIMTLTNQIAFLTYPILSTMLFHTITAAFFLQKVSILPAYKHLPAAHHFTPEDHQILVWIMFLHDQVKTFAEKLDNFILLKKQIKAMYWNLYFYV